MASRRRRERRESLTREQREERFSTGGLDFKQALRRVLAGGRGDEDKAEQGDRRGGGGE